MIGVVYKISAMVLGSGLYIALYYANLANNEP